MDKICVASIMLTSGTSPQKNLDKVTALVEKAAQAGVNWVVLPEYWPIMGQEETDKLAFAEADGEGMLQNTLAQLALKHRVSLFAGSIPLATHDPQKVSNSLLVYAPDGKRVARYDKVHLFGFTGLGEVYREADTIQAGSKIPEPIKLDGWRCGMGICYDLRFPEFFRAQSPCDALILPAAFTHTTGQAHWELLLRARAVENQCYVIASAQGGQHENGRRTFGHSMIIDPWGEIVAMHNEGEGFALAEISLSRIQSIRSKLPALKNRVFK